MVDSKEITRLRNILNDTCPHHSVPLSVFIDRKGRRLRLCRLGNRDLLSLVDMYDHFNRTQVSLGIPPRGHDRIQSWLQGLFEHDIQLIAKHGTSVVAHAAWINDRQGGAEVVVFVHQDYQGAGLGKKLLAAVVTLSKFVGIKRLWAEVENNNIPVLRMNQDLGFYTKDWHHSTREMELEPYPQDR